MSEYIKSSLSEGLLWPEPLIQMNPSFERAEGIEELVNSRVLHEECRYIFRDDKKEGDFIGKPMTLYRHQSQAIRTAQTGRNYILTTGTGSGKSMAYFIPIIDHILKEGPGKGIRAIIVYPMNALANSQFEALDRFLKYWKPKGNHSITYARYTSQERDEKRKEIRENPPDILITNYVMMELILTREEDRKLLENTKNIKFLVIDELHTHRGRQGADVAFLIRRLRERVLSKSLQCVGTSATLAGGGTYESQQQEIANMAALFFGDSFLPSDIIGETLVHATLSQNLEDPDFIEKLRLCVTDENRKPPASFEEFVRDPLSIWLENTLGIRTEPQTGRLVRAIPGCINGENGAAQALSSLTGISPERSLKLIHEGLMAGYTCRPHSYNNFSAVPFAFRIHQFISRGGSLYASIESQEKRYLTTQPQKYVPRDRSRVLFPVVFCRECGQEYYRVIRREHNSFGKTFIPWSNEDDLREIENENLEPGINKPIPGYLYSNSNNPWPLDENELIHRVPENWIELHNGTNRIKRDKKKFLPEPVALFPDGGLNQHGFSCHFIPQRFQFCLNCGISYYRQRSEFAKLSSLASEGRSSATTVLNLSCIKDLRKEMELPQKAKKIMSFSDNRQDASLQSGHFNDFIETSVLRSAIYKAALSASEEGLRHSDLVQAVFDALDLPFKSYASNPEADYRYAEDTRSALRGVLGYRIFRDLKRGWRVNSPNLEQCGLLEIHYISLHELCSDQSFWSHLHPVLANASPATREKVAFVLLNTLRRELAIKVNYLDMKHQTKIKDASDQRLIEPWGFDENESLEPGRIAFPCSGSGIKASKKEKELHVYLSPRSGFGYYLLRRNTFENNEIHLKLEDGERIIRQLFDVLLRGNIVEKVTQLKIAQEDIPGYQLVANAMTWKAGIGDKVHLDPIRFPDLPEEGGNPNSFFVQLYRSGLEEIKGIEAREHTAQVKAEDREEREKKFREGELPILFCSPTMELGVDIKDLNVVNMRNIPPAPANYAQRSGRAGRSGQPALVFSYCSMGSSHDQYFFKRPQNIVSGAVKTPCMDLANENLVRAHIHSIWLGETQLNLGASLTDILDLSSDDLPLLERVKDSISDPKVNERAYRRARIIIEQLEDKLIDSGWYTNQWLEEVIKNAQFEFDLACMRWRDKYRNAVNQFDIQTQRIKNALTKEERKRAEHLARDASAQLELLKDTGQVVNSEYYSYRYFAAQGFLPGYNFPRLPVTAFIPARKGVSKEDSLSRPRFLAISEFGPRATLYHEGARYRIDRVMLPLSSEGELNVQSIKCCPQCGYLHQVTPQEDFDVCLLCGEQLKAPLRDLLKLQDVSAYRIDRINSDEEERLRMGYSILTGFQFAKVDGKPRFRNAEIRSGEILLARLKYSDAVNLWRLNLGRKSSSKKGNIGYELHTDTGSWAKNEDESQDENHPTIEPDTPGSKKRKVIPYVEDWRNCLILTIETQHKEPGFIVSIKAALKKAIQVEFQLEDSELAVEALPDNDNCRHLLFYESAEGGAGVLRKLTDDPRAMKKVAEQALDICHFDPLTGEDRKRAPMAKEDCEAACYDCLMSYYNQVEHDKLDRILIRDFLMNLTSAQVFTSPGANTREQQVLKLLNASQSQLEKQWIQFIHEKKLNLPKDAQVLIPSCRTRPDFIYEGNGVLAAIYIDGPHHMYPDRVKRDAEQEECLDNNGYRVIRFGYIDDWEAIIKKYPDIFGIS